MTPWQWAALTIAASAVVGVVVAPRLVAPPPIESLPPERVELDTGRVRVARLERKGWTFVELFEDGRATLLDDRGTWWVDLGPEHAAAVRALRVEVGRVDRAGVGGCVSRPAVRIDGTRAAMDGVDPLPSENRAIDVMSHVERAVRLQRRLAHAELVVRGALLVERDGVGEPLGASLRVDEVLRAREGVEPPPVGSAIDDPVLEGGDPGDGTWVLERGAWSSESLAPEEARVAVAAAIAQNPALARESLEWKIALPLEPLGHGIDMRSGRSRAEALGVPSLP